MRPGQWDLDGLLLGPGTPWTVTAVPEGLGSPEIRASGALLPRDHGAGGGEDLAGVREWEIEVATSGDPEEVGGRLQDLRARMQPRSTDGVLAYRAPGAAERVSFVRPVRVVPSWRGGRYLSALLRLTAHDPVVYSVDQHALALEPYASAEFAAYPADPTPDSLAFGAYPKLYSSGGSGGGRVAANAGDWPVWPRIVITGPDSGALNVERLENVTSGAAVQFTAHGGLRVPAGQTLVVDMHPARRIVRFASGADRLHTVVDLDSWWQLPSGESELRLRASGDTAGAACTVEWRDGWL